MTKRLLFLLILGFLFACGDDDSNGDDTTGDDTTGDDDVTDSGPCEGPSCPPPGDGGCPPPGAEHVPAHCVDGGGDVTDAGTDTGAEDVDAGSDSGPVDAGPPALTAFFYQTVEPGVNHVYPSISSDGIVMDAYGVAVMEFDTMGDDIDPYGDPNFSLLSNGNWAMTSSTGIDHPSGASQLLYYEASCPQVVDDDMVLITPSEADGCEETALVSLGKRSEVFDMGDGGNGIFLTTGLYVNLVRLSDATHDAADLGSTGICQLGTVPDSIDELAWGEAAPIIRAPDTGIYLSDTAIARRGDGTWVLFIKGIPEDNGCDPLSLCELCARGIYRTTSTDLIHWDELERVVDEASVPEAFTSPDGKVWLYWQDFGPTCLAEDMMLGSRAPFAAAYEDSTSDYDLVEAGTVSIPGEAFETDTMMHYPTNPNPVALPDLAARNALEECLGI